MAPYSSGGISTWNAPLHFPHLLFLFDFWPEQVRAPQPPGGRTCHSPARRSVENSGPRMAPGGLGRRCWDAAMLRCCEARTKLSSVSRRKDPRLHRPAPDFEVQLSDSAFALPDPFQYPVYFQETLLMFTFAVAWSALLPGRRGADQGWLLFEGTVVLPAPGAALSKMVMLDAVTRRNPQPALWVCHPRPSICFLLVLPGPQKHRRQAWPLTTPSQPAPAQLSGHVVTGSPHLPSLCSSLWQSRVLTSVTARFS